MTAHRAKNKKNAKAAVNYFSRKGFTASKYKLKGKGWGVSVTKPK